MKRATLVPDDELPRAAAPPPWPGRSVRLDGQAIDLPGFGRSDPARNCSIAAFADRVARWIEHADRGPVHLFGNSLGGAVAVPVAGCRPGLVRTLTLVSPAMPF